MNLCILKQHNSLNPLLPASYRPFLPPPPRSPSWYCDCSSFRFLLPFFNRFRVRAILLSHTLVYRVVRVCLGRFLACTRTHTHLLAHVGAHSHLNEHIHWHMWAHTCRPYTTRAEYSGHACSACGVRMSGRVAACRHSRGGGGGGRGRGRGTFPPLETRRNTGV
jgi:uncharacterized CHY-type Zn-finger protein